MDICDLHTHVLPAVDDGAQTMASALQMLENAAASDVKVLAATPHCNGIYGGGNYLDQNLLDRFAELKAAAQDTGIRLILGAEALANEDLPRHLADGKIPTINGSRYLLTEFFTDTPESCFGDMLQSILQLGYIPLVAHPERYAAVCKNPRTVVRWLDMGCHLQLTAASIQGKYGKIFQETAAFLLRNDLVACVASDAHGTSRRNNFLLDVHDHLRVQYSKQYAQCLLYENPMRICCNDDLC